MNRILPALIVATVLSFGASAAAQVSAEFSDEFDTESTAPAVPTNAPSAEPAAKPAQSANAPAGTTAAQAVVPAAAIGTDTERPETQKPVPTEHLDTRDAQRLRVHNTWFGPTGGLHVLDAGSGPAGTFGLQLGVDFFSASDFLVQGDQNDYSGATLALRMSVTDYLELFGAMASHANNNNQENPQLLQVLGDTQFGVKGYASVLPWLTLGGDFRLVVLNTVGSIGPVFSAMSFGLRGNVSADLRGLDKPVPLILRASFDYFFDNSANLVEEVEAQRLEALSGGPTGLAGVGSISADNQDKHLIRRVERFALGINRTDAFGIALGVEAPLRAAEDFFIHPLVEWTLAVPVNRQGYSCLLLAERTGPADPDGCLDSEGFAAMPSTLTFGVRLLPPVRGLAFVLGVDIGVSGTSIFVRELAGNKPYDVMFALSYAVDPRPVPATRLREVEVIREVNKAKPENPRIEGVAVDLATGGPVAQAVVRYLDQELTAQQVDAQGKFISYELPPGEARLEFSHPDYETRICSVRLPVPSDAGLAVSRPATTAAPAAGTAGPAQPPAINPYYQSNTSAAGSKSSAAKGVVLLVAMRCELTPKPRAGGVRGRVQNAQGQPVAGAAVQLSGPSNESLTSDAQGEFVHAALAVGSYSVRVDAPGYLIRSATFDVKPAGTATLDLTLDPQPKQSQVELTAKEVRIRKELFFKTNSAELSSKSSGLLSEIADVLLRNPQVAHLEIQGHTDNTGSPEVNKQLSQDRAEAVRTALITAGVDGGRLTAKGYGDTRPLVPNLTERHRARNRRVQFIIREQE